MQRRFCLAASHSLEITRLRTHGASKGHLGTQWAALVPAVSMAMPMVAQYVDMMHWVVLVVDWVKPGGHMAGWLIAVHMPVALGVLLSMHAFWPTAGKLRRRERGASEQWAAGGGRRAAGGGRRAAGGGRQAAGGGRRAAGSGRRAAAPQAAEQGAVSQDCFAVRRTSGPSAHLAPRRWAGRRWY
jgi:hypothetical protein